MLKLLGVAAIPVATPRAQASESEGYGTSGYGDGVYGGETGDEGSEESDETSDEESEESDETGDEESEESDEADDSADERLEIDEYHVEEDSPPNPHADVHVSWSVSSLTGSLDYALIEVFEQSGEGSLVDSEVIDLDGSAESGTVSFRVSHGSGHSYRVSLEVSDDVGHTVTDERVVEAT